ncbi:hypothetical protein JHK87_033306 [Glycine soja]|nr:hypothetical protein JHK87_033306 [Glycine soja]
MFRKEWDILSFSSTACETNEEPNDGKGKEVRITYQATSFPADRIPDIGKRQLMNLLLLGALHSLLLECFSHIPISLSLQGQFFLHSHGPSTGGTVAKDAIGNDVIAEKWLETHGPGDRTLTQGLKLS